jgi:hypothetical protein
MRNSLSSVMSKAQHTFAMAPQANIPRSRFDRSHGYKTTFNAGLLIPFFVDEVLPGDTFNCKLTAISRLATPIYPIMDNMFMDFHFFYVPTRLLWDNWEQFNGAQANPTDSTSFLVPYVGPTTSDPYPSLSLADYFGIPPQITFLAVNALPFRAYNLIWNEWYRDENLQDSVTNITGNGPDNMSSYGDNGNPLPRGKRKDYFTSCLPFPQKGPQVTLPLGVAAPVQIAYAAPPGTPNSTTAPNPHLWESVSWTKGNIPTLGADFWGPNVGAVSSPLAATSVSKLVTSSNSQPVVYDPAGTLYANLSTATAATINEIRQAFQVQKMYERDARGGTRYTEILHSHFGVISPDSRLQRPEFLGGGTSYVDISAVPQTSGTGDYATTPQGSLAAFGTSSTGGQIGFTRSFTEHGYVIGLVSVRADLTYQQGTARMWFRTNRFSFYWPALSHLGEQAVLNQEIYTVSGGTSIYPGANNNSNSQVFGYQEIWAEYRYKPALVTGAFRSNTPGGSLDAWHLSQNFSALPVLNDSFIQETPPVSRIIAVPTAPQFLLDTFITLHCARPMPVYSVPGLVDHF